MFLEDFAALVVLALVMGANGYTDSDCYKDGVHITGPVAIEGECESYLLCSNSAAPIEMPCPDGLAFDPTLSVCRFATDVPACFDMNGIDAAAYYCYDDNGKFVTKPPFPKPGTCNTFYECLNKQLTERQCPPNLVFKPESMLCDYPSDPPDCFPSTTLFPDYNKNPDATILPETTTNSLLGETTTTLSNSVTSTDYLEPSTDGTTKIPTTTTTPPTTIVTHDPPFFSSTPTTASTITTIKTSDAPSSTKPTDDPHYSSTTVETKLPTTTTSKITTSTSHITTPTGSDPTSTTSTERTTINTATSILTTEGGSEHTQT
uniref:chitinase n=1 Tax=Ciona savignyi TaxID=51511 RepID=H2Z270_CIOSA